MSFLFINSNNTEFFMDGYYEEEVNIYIKRVNDIANTCIKYGLNQNSNISSAFGLDYQKLQTEYANTVPSKYSMMYLEKYSLLYCWIHKAASSSWNRIFYQKINKKVKDSSLHHAAEAFRPNAKTDLQDLFNSSKISFLFVRHPFERLVSAFRDKFELGKKTDWCYKMYAGDILNISTPLFKKKDDAYMKFVYSKVRNLERPNFPQFISYLLRIPVMEFNDHWSPYWLHCQVCHNRFNVVGKFETIREDIEHISNSTNLNVDITKFPWANKKGGKDAVSFKYFKLIDYDSIMKLYHIYKLDFEMFGYSVEDYLVHPTIKSLDEISNDK